MALNLFSPLPRRWRAEARRGDGEPAPGGASRSRQRDAGEDELARSQHRMRLAQGEAAAAQELLAQLNASISEARARSDFLSPQKTRTRRKVQCGVAGQAHGMVCATANIGSC